MLSGIRHTGDCGLIIRLAMGPRYILRHKEQFGQEAEADQKTIEVSRQVRFDRSKVVIRIDLSVWRCKSCSKLLCLFSTHFNL